MIQSENLITALDQFKTVVYLKNRQGHYLSMNEQGAIAMNCTTDKVLGKTPYEIFDFNSAKKMTETDQYVATRKDVYTIQYNSKDKNTGEPIPMYTAKTSIVSPSGEHLGIVGISLIVRNDTELFAEARRLLPEFVKRKQPHLLNELLQLRKVSDFLKLYQLH